MKIALHDARFGNFLGIILVTGYEPKLEAKEQRMNSSLLLWSTFSEFDPWGLGAHRTRLVLCAALFSVLCSDILASQYVNRVIAFNSGSRYSTTDDRPQSGDDNQNDPSNSRCTTTPTRTTEV